MGTRYNFRCDECVNRPAPAKKRRQKAVAAVTDPAAAVTDPVAAVADPVAAVGGPVAAIADPVAAVADPVAAVANPVAAVGGPVADEISWLGSDGSGHEMKKDLISWRRT